jgi:CBS domain-containing protein
MGVSNMLVREYMTKEPIVLSPEDDVKSAFNLLVEKRIRQAPVVQKGELVGMATDRDLRTAMVQSLKINKIKVGIVMTKDPVTITEDTNIVDAGKLMSAGKFNAIPVVEESGRLKGIITTTDILNFLTEKMDENYVNLITK